MQKCDIMLFYNLYTLNYFQPVSICIYSMRVVLSLYQPIEYVLKLIFIFGRIQTNIVCEFYQFFRAHNMAASLSAMALRRFAPKILRSSSALPLTSPFSTSPSSLISSSSPSLAPVVQKPAPAFKAQAVVDGQFKEVHTVLLIFSNLRYILQCLRFNLHFTCTGVSL